MSMCCVCNKTTPLVVKHACCLPYRCFGYAPVPLLAGQFLGPIAGETGMSPLHMPGTAHTIRVCPLIPLTEA